MKNSILINQKKKINNADKLKLNEMKLRIEKKKQEPVKYSVLKKIFEMNSYS